MHIVSVHVPANQPLTPGELADLDDEAAEVEAVRRLYRRLHAPAGHCIVNVYARRALNAPGDAVPWQVSAYELDDEDRPVTAIVQAQEPMGGQDRDYTAYAVCVPF